ncbi:MAG: hotdog fold thioesterase [Clostridia bacterium]|jgi:acyl-CoA thioesterase|nr:hotdog fold thioesterase [Clostridia bacterium]
MNNDITKHTANDRFAAHLGIKLLEAGPGYALAEMEIKEHHLNGVDVVHGGAIFGLADFVFAVACNAKGPVTLAVNASISYFKAPKGKILTAEAREVTSSRKLGHYHVDIRDEDKELIARFTGTGYIKGGN